MATPRTRGPATAADIEDERQEVVRGELVRKASPGFVHGTVQYALGAALAAFRGRAGAGGRLGGWWLGHEIEIELAPHEIYLPDIAGWRIERVPAPLLERPVRITPDWVCEILSPSTTARDLGHKRSTYHQAHVDHYWIVDPVERALTICRWHDKDYRTVLVARVGEFVRAEPFDTIELDISDIFGV